MQLKFYSTDGSAFGIDRILCNYTQAPSGIANGSSITLGATTANTNLIGHNWTLDLSGEDITGSYIFQSTNLFGIGTGTNGSPFTIQECQIGTATLDCFCFMEKCAFSSTVTWASTSGVSADVVDILNSFSNVAGAGVPTLTWAAVTKTTNINIRKWYGGGTWVFTSDCVASIEVGAGGTHTITTGGGDVELRGAPKAVSVTTSGSGTTNIIVWSGCPITIAGTAGTVNIYGKYGAVTPSASGGTINLYGEHGTVGSTGGATVNDNGQDYMDLTTVLTQVGTAGAGLTDLGGMSTAMKAEVNTEADTALTDYDGPTNAEMNARTPTAAQLAYIVANAATGLPVTFTTSGGSTTAAVLNQVDGAGASATDDQYNGRLLVFTDGTLKGVVTDITNYTGGTTTATITAIPTAPTASHNARLI